MATEFCSCISTNLKDRYRPCIPLIDIGLVFPFVRREFHSPSVVNPVNYDKQNSIYGIMHINPSDNNLVGQFTDFCISQSFVRDTLDRKGINTRTCVAGVR